MSARTPPPNLQGKIQRVFPERQYGFIITGCMRNPLYFQFADVVGDLCCEDLQEGLPVTFSLSRNRKGVVAVRVSAALESQPSPDQPVLPGETKGDVGSMSKKQMKKMKQRLMPKLLWRSAEKEGEGEGEHVAEAADPSPSSASSRQLSLKSRKFHVTADVLLPPDIAACYLEPEDVEHHQERQTQAVAMTAFMALQENDSNRHVALRRFGRTYMTCLRKFADERTQLSVLKSANCDEPGAASAGEVAVLQGLARRAERVWKSSFACGLPSPCPSRPTARGGAAAAAGGADASAGGTSSSGGEESPSAPSPSVRRDGNDPLTTDGLWALQEQLVAGGQEDGSGGGDGQEEEDESGLSFGMGSDSSGESEGEGDGGQGEGGRVKGGAGRVREASRIPKEDNPSVTKNSGEAGGEPSSADPAPSSSAARGGPDAEPHSSPENAPPTDESENEDLPSCMRKVSFCRGRLLFPSPSEILPLLTKVLRDFQQVMERSDIGACAKAVWLLANLALIRPVERGGNRLMAVVAFAVLAKHGVPLVPSLSSSMLSRLSRRVIETLLSWRTQQDQPHTHTEGGEGQEARKQENTEGKGVEESDEEVAKKKTGATSEVEGGKGGVCGGLKGEVEEKAQHDPKCPSKDPPTKTSPIPSAVAATAAADRTEKQSGEPLCGGETDHSSSLSPPSRPLPLLADFTGTMAASLDGLWLQFENDLEGSVADLAQDSQAAARRARAEASRADCVICYETSPQVSSVCCGAVYHVKCLALWLSHHNSTCPACRAALQYDSVSLDEVERGVGGTAHQHAAAAAAAAAEAAAWRIRERQILEERELREEQFMRVEALVYAQAGGRETTRGRVDVAGGPNAAAAAAGAGYVPQAAVHPVQVAVHPVPAAQRIVVDAGEIRQGAAAAGGGGVRAAAPHPTNHQVPIPLTAVRRPIAGSPTNQNPIALARERLPAPALPRDAPVQQQQQQQQTDPAQPPPQNPYAPPARRQVAQPPPAEAPTQAAPLPAGTAVLIRPAAPAQQVYDPWGGDFTPTQGPAGAGVGGVPNAPGRAQAADAGRAAAGPPYPAPGVRFGATPDPVPPAAAAAGGAAAVRLPHAFPARPAPAPAGPRGPHLLPAAAEDRAIQPTAAHAHALNDETVLRAEALDRREREYELARQRRDRAVEYARERVRVVEIARERERERYQQQHQRQQLQAPYVPPARGEWPPPAARVGAGGRDRMGGVAAGPQGAVVDAAPVVEVGGEEWPQRRYMPAEGANAPVAVAGGGPLMREFPPAAGALPFGGGQRDPPAAGVPGPPVEAAVFAFRYQMPAARGGEGDPEAAPAGAGVLVPGDIERERGRERAVGGRGRSPPPPVRTPLGSPRRDTPDNNHAPAGRMCIVCAASERSPTCVLFACQGCCRRECPPNVICPSHGVLARPAAQYAPPPAEHAVPPFHAGEGVRVNAGGLDVDRGDHRDGLHGLAVVPLDRGEGGREPGAAVGVVAAEGLGVASGVLHGGAEGPVFRILLQGGAVRPLGAQPDGGRVEGGGGVHGPAAVGVVRGEGEREREAEAVRGQGRGQQGAGWGRGGAGRGLGAHPFILPHQRD
uniref:RING-type domain-containing protein n=1 Tax=Chromera velia CCMP2878 TaxID=1169474 RepID=A0A0G4IBP5_9ALVE|eukprot:Cvel_12828.t1-p1 / transcript=Cvel_12828.t1 / gene=Cvel_12828 / organism=Chromera_velia_CCMP2878 / gene_product=hypothetical protein / transcript_product=hypothetical protein / location=Cvel_scaffold855:48288-53360(+) / protein_length=1582 / sequence_SO=supercontig / SO=protein_coding / is_pseudo=false